MTILNNMLGNNFFKNKIDYNSNPTLEAQLASISDDIAYNSHDLEDGLNAKLFTLKDISEIPILKNIVKKHKNRIQ